MRNDQHVIPTERGWAVRRTGSTKASSVHETQQEAIERARQLLQKTGGGELIVHRRDGRIRDADTVFGRDPSPPRDRKH